MKLNLGILSAAQGSEIAIVEIGGTVGDIESLPFIEAIRQMRVDLGGQNTMYVHVTYIPYIKASGELKSKPTQHSVKALREVGIQPDVLICRSEHYTPSEIKSKIGLFCNIHPNQVISAYDASNIYQVPIMLHQEGFDEAVVQKLGLKKQKPSLSEWKKMVSTVESPVHESHIGIVGKYTHLKESYKSLNEALSHGGMACNAKVQITYVDSEDLCTSNLDKKLSQSSRTPCARGIWASRGGRKTPGHWIRTRK